MNRNNDFMIKIMNLSDSDLEKIYQMACQRLKDEKASGKDTSETEQKLTIISGKLSIFFYSRRDSLPGKDLTPVFGHKDSNFPLS